MPDRFGKTFRRQTHAQMGGVSRLATGFTPRAFFADGRWRLRRILRWRYRRVGGILVQPRPQFADRVAQFGPRTAGAVGPKCLQLVDTAIAESAAGATARPQKTHGA